MSKTTASTPAPPSVSPELAAQIDELGAIEEQLAPLKPKIKRAEALRKVIAAAVEDPADSKKFDGTRFCALVGARQNQRFIKSMPGLFKLIGKTAFLEVCRVTLDAVEKLVGNEGELAKLIGTAQTGPRDVKTYRIVG